MPIEINGQLSQPWKENGFEASLPKSGKAQFRIVRDIPPKRRTEDGVINVPIPLEMFEPHYTRTTMNNDTQFVRYFKSKNKRNNLGVVEDVYDPNIITIDGGNIVINTKTDPDLYWFLVNHPKNKTNPLYDKDLNPEANLFIEKTYGVYLIEEVKQSKDAKAMLEQEEKISNAVAKIRAYTDNQAKLIYTSIGKFRDADVLERSGDYDSMRIAIIQYMKNNFIKWERLHNDTGVGVRAAIHDAVNLNIIEAKDGQWQWNLTSDEKKKPLILKCNDFNNKEDELYDFLRTEARGFKYLEEIQKEIGFIKRNPDAQRVYNKPKNG